MLDPDLKPAFDKRFSLLNVVCSAMAAGVAVYAAVGLFLAGRSAPVASAGVLKTVFYLLAGLEIGVALTLRRRLLSDEALQPAARGGLEALLQAVQTRHIVLFAVWESLGVFGLVLAILSASAAELWPFAAAAALGMALCWPRGEAWEERAERLLGSARRDKPGFIS